MLLFFTPLSFHMNSLYIKLNLSIPSSFQRPIFPPSYLSFSLSHHMIPFKPNLLSLHSFKILFFSCCCLHLPITPYGKLYNLIFPSLHFPFHYLSFSLSHHISNLIVLSLHPFHPSILSIYSSSSDDRLACVRFFIQSIPMSGLASPLSNRCM